MSTCPFRPLRDYIVAKKGDSESVSKGGIHLVLSAREQQNSAVVVAVGTGSVSNKDSTITPLSVVVGDTILFCEDEKKAREQGNLVKVIEDQQEVEYWFLKERQVIGVVSPEQS